MRAATCRLDELWTSFIDRRPPDRPPRILILRGGRRRPCESISAAPYAAILLAGILLSFLGFSFFSLRQFVPTDSTGGIRRIDFFPLFFLNNRRAAKEILWTASTGGPAAPKNATAVKRAVNCHVCVCQVFWPLVNACRVILMAATSPLLPFSVCRFPEISLNRLNWCRIRTLSCVAPAEFFSSLSAAH